MAGSRHIEKEDPRELVAAWKASGRTREVKGMQVFYRDTAEAELPAVVFLHGYPSASFDFRHVMLALKGRFRLVAHDHPGFGLSGKPRHYSYSLLDQAAVALDLWRGLGLERVHIVAHDYGTSVATEILARRPEGEEMPEMASVTLSNGSVHIEMARLRLIQMLLLNRRIGPVLARFSNKHLYIRQMRRLWYDRSKCSSTELEALWLMTRRDKGALRLPQITQYLRERYSYWDRWIGALKVLDIPAHILWAQDDPVAVAAIGEQLYREIPGAVITRMPDTGHYPMLEAPGPWAEAVGGFIDGI